MDVDPLRNWVFVAIVRANDHSYERVRAALEKSGIRLIGRMVRGSVFVDVPKKDYRRAREILLQDHRRYRYWADFVKVR